MTGKSDQEYHVEQFTMEKTEFGKYVTKSFVNQMYQKRWNMPVARWLKRRMSIGMWRNELTARCARWFNCNAKGVKAKRGCG